MASSISHCYRLKLVVCASTETLQAKVEELNAKLVKEAFDEEVPADNQKIVVGSLDFKAWYPSMKVEVVVPVIRKRLEKSPSDIKVCELELARFLYIMMDDEDIAAEGMEDLLHTMKDPSENKPRLTDKEMVGGDNFRKEAKSKLNPPARQPNPSETKKMTAIAMSLIVKKVMTNFFYTFGGKDRRQAGGGPIGDVLTQAISRHIGNEFDELFTSELTKLAIKNELYERYADDIDVANRSIGRMIKFCPLAGRMVPKTETEIENDAEKEEDELTINQSINRFFIGKTM